jgi:hypothetical protein
MRPRTEGSTRGVMDARTIVESISDGINAIQGLLGNASTQPSATLLESLPPEDLVERLDVLEQALAALLGGSFDDEISSRPHVDDLHCIRKLGQLVAAWRENGVASPDLPLLAEDCLARVLRWGGDDGAR